MTYKNKIEKEIKNIIHSYSMEYMENMDLDDQEKRHIEEEVGQSKIILAWIQAKTEEEIEYLRPLGFAGQGNRVKIYSHRLRRAVYEN